jgi:hypothetical protein
LFVLKMYFRKKENLSCPFGPSPWARTDPLRHISAAQPPAHLGPIRPWPPRPDVGRRPAWACAPGLLGVRAYKRQAPRAPSCAPAPSAAIPRRLALPPESNRAGRRLPLRFAAPIRRRGALPEQAEAAMRFATPS